MARTVGYRPYRAGNQGARSSNRRVASRSRRSTENDEGPRFAGGPRRVLLAGLPAICSAGQACGVAAAARRRCGVPSAEDVPQLRGVLHHLGLLDLSIEAVDLTSTCDADIGEDDQVDQVAVDHAE